MDAVEGGRHRPTTSARRRQRAATEQHPARGIRRPRGGIQPDVAPPPPPIAPPVPPPIPPPVDVPAGDVPDAEQHPARGRRRPRGGIQPDVAPSPPPIAPPVPPPVDVPAGDVPDAEAAHVVDAPEDAPAAAVWDGIGPLPGGPVDESLLISFRTHVASQIWVNRDYRGVMRPHSHTKILEPPHVLTQIIERTRLSPLVTCSFRWTHKALVTAFVERWQPDTNTFHMPFGEMTITLDDVATILGIPVIGKVVSCPKLDDAVARDLLVSALGVEDSDASLALRDVRGQSVKLSWLKTKFANLGDAPTVERTTYAARAYLLYLLGSTLFTDKSGGRVSIGLLHVLQDLDTVHEYGWGAAALATLYRHLGMASRSDCKQIAGYLTLLEAWVYEHFPMFQPPRKVGYVDVDPCVLRWAPLKDQGSSLSHLYNLREALDDLQSESVVWDPYSCIRAHHPLEEFTYYAGLLHCVDIVEPYQPDRVLRQFGRVQYIPRAPVQPTSSTRGSSAQSYSLLFNVVGNQLETWMNHLLAADARSSPVSFPGETIVGYMDWFRGVSHTRVQNPAHRAFPLPVVEPPVQPVRRDPQECIDHALKIGLPVLDMDRADACTDPTMLYGTIRAIVRVLQGRADAVEEGCTPDIDLIYSRANRRRRTGGSST